MAMYGLSCQGKNNHKAPCIERENLLKLPKNCSVNLSSLDLIFFSSSEHPLKTIKTFTDHVS